MNYIKSAILFLLCSIPILGAKAEVGVTDTEVVIGAHTCESGASASYAPVPRAEEAYFNKINEKGGINGRKIRFIREDTAGSYQKAAVVTKKLVESDKIFAMVGGHNDNHVAAYKYLAENNIPDLFFNDGVDAYEPFSPMTFPYSQSYRSDGVTMAEYAIKELKGKRVCFISSKTLAEDLPKGFISTVEKYNKTATEKNKITLGLNLSVDRTITQADSDVSKLKEDGCEGVVMTIAMPVSAQIVNYAYSQNFKPKWMVFWWNTSIKFVDLLNEGVREGIISTAAMARSKTFNVPGWDEFQALMEKNNLPATGVSASGYMIAELFTEALKRAGRDLTRQKIVDAVLSLNGWQCDICLQPVQVTKDSHWMYKKPVLAVIRNGVWTRY